MMKRVYKTPKAKLIDFTYDEQVTADSQGVALYGDPQHIGRCQQSSDETCTYFWTSIPAQCEATPRMIIRGL